MSLTEHYNAFISYRHNERDSSAAQSIQRGLEHFVVPPSVRKKTGIRRIDRVFRDKEELPITRDLGENIDRALAGSDYLIVICSPELKESRWCMREIEVFLTTHDTDRVLTVVTEGEPADVIPAVLLEKEVQRTDPVTGQTYTEKIPVEPLSCDYRKTAATRKRRDFHETEKTELPRLAAVILGCTYDELIRRRHQYEMRRFLFAGSLFLLASAAATGYFAWSRNEIRGSYDRALISQSRELAVRSQESLDDEDRVGAVRLAMQALPSAEDPRPVTAEAEYALTEALGVYSSGQELEGTWIFEARDRIVDYSYSESGKYLIAMDRSGALTVWDVKERERLAVWEIARDEDIPAFKLLSEDCAVVFRGNTIFAMNYLTGEQLWVRHLPYAGISAELSSDRRTVFAENRRALYQLDAVSGEDIRVLDAASGENVRAPEQDAAVKSGYFFSIQPNPAGDAALVQVRETGDGEASRFYLWHPEKESLIPLGSDAAYRGVIRYGWADGESVYICHQEDRAGSFSGEKIIQVADAPLHVVCIDTVSGREIWKTTHEFSGLSEDVPAVPTLIAGQDRGMKEGLLVAYGQTVLTLDLENGKTLLRRDLGAQVLGFLAAYPDRYLAALESGQVALVSYAPKTVVYYKQFAGGILSVMQSPADNMLENEVLVLRDGKILLYEASKSGVYEPCRGDVSLQPPLKTEEISGKYLVTLTQEPGLLVTDRETMTSEKVLLEGDAFSWRILGSTVGDAGEGAGEADHEAGGGSDDEADDEAGGGDGGGRKAILACNGEKLSFHLFDPATKEMKLIAEDDPFAVDYGLFFADYGRFFGKYDRFVLYSDGDHTLRKLDTKSGEIMSVRPEGLADTQHLQNAYRKDLISYGSLLMPAPVFVSPGGAFALTTFYDEETSETGGILVDLRNGAVTRLEKILYDGILAAAFNEEETLAAVSGNFLVNIYDMKGNIHAQISCAGRRILSMTWRGKELLVLYSDKTLERYDAEGELIGTTQLIFSDTPMGIYEMIRWSFTDSRLYLMVDHDLCIADVKNWPQHQNAAAGSCLLRTGDGNIWNYMTEPGPDMTAAYRIGKFRELTVDELMAMGREIAGE